MEKLIKILFIHNQLVCGGAEKALLDLINLMDKSQFDITVYALKYGGELEDEFKKSGIRVLNPYSRLKSSRLIIGKIKNVIKIKMIKRSMYNKGKNLIPLTTHEDFDLIISYHVYEDLYKAGLLKKSKSIKYIHANISTNDDYRIHSKYMLNENCNYDKIVCVSEESKKSFINFIGKTSNIVSLYNPIDDKSIDELSKKCFVNDLNIPYFCAVGRLGKEKGYDRLIHIVKRLKQNDINVGLLIVGDGQEKQYLYSLIKDFKLENTIKMLGYLENPYPVIRNGLFTAISSYTEGMPVVAMESICLGKPIVSCCDCLNELFGGFDCGIISDNDDESLYQAIYKMLTDKDFYNKTLEQVGIRRKYFTGRRMVKKIEDEYMNTLLNRRKE